jgi:hypothetical protein
MIQITASIFRQLSGQVPVSVGQAISFDKRYSAHAFKGVCKPYEQV